MKDSARQRSPPYFGGTTSKAGGFSMASKHSNNKNHSRNPKSYLGLIMRYDPLIHTDIAKKVFKQAASDSLSYFTDHLVVLIKQQSQ